MKSKFFTLYSYGQYHQSDIANTLRSSGGDIGGGSQVIILIERSDET